MKRVVYAGLDVHKDSITIAVARGGRKPAEKWLAIPYDVARLLKTLKMLVKSGEVLKVCYEAGPMGFGLRRLSRMTTVFSYHRVSTNVQETKEQVKGNRQYAQENDIAVLNEYGEFGKRHHAHKPRSSSSTESGRHPPNRAKPMAKFVSRRSRSRLEGALCTHLAPRDATPLAEREGYVRRFTAASRASATVRRALIRA